MMWSSKLVVAAATVSSLLLSVSGHAIIAADQGTLDGLSRGDVTRGNLQGCSNFAGAGTATIQNGVVNLVAKNFNGGRDGSTQFKAALSTTGRNGNFQAVDVTQNGEAAPKGNVVSPITVAIPAGTDCSGGCTLAFQSAGNFGNCVDVAGAAAAAGDAGAAATTDAGTAATTDAGAAATTDAGAAATTDAGAAATTTTTSTTTTATGRRRKGKGRGRNRGANRGANGGAAAGGAAGGAAAGGAAAGGAAAGGAAGGAAAGGAAAGGAAAGGAAAGGAAAGGAAAGGAAAGGAAAAQRNAANRASRLAALKAKLQAAGRPHARSFRIPGETDESVH